MKVLISLSATDYELVSRLRVWSDSVHYLKGAVIDANPTPMDRSMVPVGYVRHGVSVSHNSIMAKYFIDVPTRPAPHFPSPTPMVPMLQKDVIVHAAVYWIKDGLKKMRQIDHALKVSPSENDLLGLGLGFVTNLIRAWFQHTADMATAHTMGNGQDLITTIPSDPFNDEMQKTKPTGVSKYKVSGKRRKRKKEKVNTKGAEMDTQPAFHMQPRF